MSSVRSPQKFRLFLLMVGVGVGTAWLSACGSEYQEPESCSTETGSSNPCPTGPGVVTTAS